MAQTSGAFPALYDNVRKAPMSANVQKALAILGKRGFLGQKKKKSCGCQPEDTPPGTPCGCHGAK